ncbi:MAG TPA: hypothetical protein PLY93_12350 [Turneriella sp.]|nr:hypothetical protein [Turneriella sp.]
MQKSRLIYYSLICVCIICARDILAEETSENKKLEVGAKNTLSLELLGIGGIYSVNYERSITKDALIRFGVAYLPPMRSTDNYHTLAAPLGFYYLIGQSEHKLELGFAGGFYGGYNKDPVTYGSEWKVRSAFFYSVGYRYQPVSSGIVFRITANLAFFDNIAQPWGGISLGYAY